MKALILVPQLPLNLKQIKGGAHSAVLNLLEGFHNKNISIRVISYSKYVKSSTTKYLHSNIEIVYEKEGPFTFHLLNYLFFGNYIVKKHISDFNPDVIHFQAGNAFLLSKLFGFKRKKTLLTIHGMASEEGKRKIKYSDRIKWTLNDKIQKVLLPNNIIHLSEYSNSLTQSRNLNTIIPNALSDVFFKIPLKKDTNNRIIYIGVIDNNKNIIHLLKSINHLKSIDIYYTVDVLGDFNNVTYKKYIHDYIETNKLHNLINFRGWVNKTEVVNSIAQSDILVVSSQHESLPMVIAECMAAGKVVIASTVGGIPEMITHEKDGFLFSIYKKDDLSNLLQRLYNNNIEINKISVNARSRALNQYKADEVAMKTIQFYKKIISEN
jgi:glycosyltransferase involved in cell wall biosynthesis